MSQIKSLLAISGVIEIPTGIALLAIPAQLAAILLGIDLETPADLGLARLAGAAVLSLGLCCWFGSRDAQSRAAIGIVAAMLLYNIAVVVLFVWLRYGVGLNGMGLLPVSVLHSLLAAWCIISLRSPGRSNMASSSRGID